MKWILPLLVVALSGCVETPTDDLAAVDSVEDEPVCEPKQVLETTLEYRGTQQNEMKNERFTVDRGCSEVLIRLHDDSMWAGDVEVHVESPSGLERQLFNGIGFHSEAGGTAYSGQMTIQYRVPAEEGFWLVRAAGTGTFAFHVTAYQS